MKSLGRKSLEEVNFTAIKVYTLRPSANFILPSLVLESTAEISFE
jgi:hypothetical protein